MITTALPFFVELADLPETGLAAALAVVNAHRAAASPAIAPAPAPTLITEFDSGSVAGYQLPDPATLAAGPQLLLNQATAVELPTPPGTLAGAPPAEFAATYARLDDGTVALEQLNRDAYDTLRAFARALALPFLAVRGARKELVRGGVVFGAPTLFRYAARHGETGQPVLARTLLFALPATDAFLAGGPA